MTKIVFLLSHPVQYVSPMLRQLAQVPGIALHVLYCHGENGQWDAEFGRFVAWDLPLLQGYSHEFVPNSHPRPSLQSFWGLANVGLWKALRRHKPDVLIVPGWGFLAYWLGMAAARWHGAKLWLRGESPQHQEAARQGPRQWIKKWLLRRVLFPKIDRFLYIGEQNRRFYQALGVADDRLLPSPYAVGNDFFSEACTRLAPQREALRQSLGLPADAPVILSVGKFIDKKDPLCLLEAFRLLNRPRCVLLMVGDGPLRPQMERYIALHGLNVRLAGFQNQSQISAYYAAADVFAMPSRTGETWGLAVNEAMNFGLPLVLSHWVGCAADLLAEGLNGSTFAAGDAEALAQALAHWLDHPDKRQAAALYSRQRVQAYSYQHCIAHIRQALAP